MKAKALLIFMFFIAYLPFLISGQSFSLDSTFNTDGKVIHTVGTINDEIRSIVIQPDGRILAVGLTYTLSPTTRCAMARYLPDGSLDTSFSSDGILTDDFGQLACAYTSVAMQTDGKIVAAGIARDSITTRDNIGIGRYNQDGSIDSAFGVGGKVMTDYFGHHDHARGLVIQPDGKIVAAGFCVEDSSSILNHMAIERYNIDGTLDSSFNNDGKFSFDFGTSSLGTALVMQPDGKFIIGGYKLTSPNNVSNLAVVRINTDGTLDSTFGINGKQSVATTFAVVAESVALQPDGKIVAAGYAVKNPPYYEFATMRFLANGMLDSTFSTDGIEIDSLGPYIDYAHTLAIQQDGKIIVAGASSSTGLQNDMTLVRYTTDGLRDTTFGVNGKLITIASPGFETIYAMQLQQDGKLVAGGFAEVGSQRNFELLRYTSDVALGVLEFEKTERAPLVYPNPLSYETTLSYELKKDEIISITLMNMQGKIIKNFYKNQYQLAGKYSMPILIGSEISSGCYLLNITNGINQNTVRILKQ